MKYSILVAIPVLLAAVLAGAFLWSRSSDKEERKSKPAATSAKSKNTKTPDRAVQGSTETQPIARRNATSPAKNGFALWSA